jgi:hypothetical protein
MRPISCRIDYWGETKYELSWGSSTTSTGIQWMVHWWVLVHQTLWSHCPTPTSMVWKNGTSSPVPSHDQCRVATIPKLYCLDGFLGCIQTPSFKRQLAWDTCVEFWALLSCIIWLGFVFLPLNSAHKLHDIYSKIYHSFENISTYF